MSLTFDDGDATQYQVRSMLSSRGMHATFFVNGARIGDGSYYMTWPQVDGLYADGNEIGGHTAYHYDLTKLDPTEAQREVCDDRVQLLDHGFAVTDFAYPYGARNASIETMVRNCGYNSARTTDTFGPGCSTCAETVPPADPYATRGVAGGADGLSAIESAITKTEQSGGGWAQVVLHNVCNGCTSNAISPTDLASLLDWLKARASQGTVVKTVAEVMGGGVQPAVAGPAAPPPPNGTNAILNPGLEQEANGDGVPDCFTMDAYGTHQATWTRTTDAHAGTYAERVSVSQYSSGDEKLMPVEDLGQCTPSVAAGHRYRLTTWYKSTVPVSFATFTRNSSLMWGYWNNSPTFPATSSWTQATWVTPVIPAGIDGLSFGLAVEANGTLTVDDIGMDDANASPPGDTTPPTTTITCNGSPCGSAYSASAVTVGLSAADGAGGSGVKQIVYTTDGSDPSPTNGTVYSAPFAIGATTTVKYRAYDNTGNAEGIKSQVVRVDDVAPTVSITSPATGATVSKNVTVTASASDAGGSGVASVSFYADRTPTSGGTLINTDTSSPYSARWTTGKLAGQHTLTALARDGAGNTTTSPPVTVTLR